MERKNSIYFFIFGVKKMGLIINTNSWVSVIEANNYLADKWNVGTLWTALNDTQKEQALVTAFHWIQSIKKYNISPLSTANKIKYAQIELAYYIIQYYTQHKKRDALYAQGVRNFSISKWSETIDKSTLPPEVDGLLIDFITRVGGVFPIITRDY